jgi:hypothetical protein
MKPSVETNFAQNILASLAASALWAEMTWLVEVLRAFG